MVNAEGTEVIFERNPIDGSAPVKLYKLDLATGDVQPFVDIPSTRPDWCSV